MPISVYKRGGSLHIRDTEGNHWTLRNARGGRDPGDGSPIDPSEEILQHEATLYHRSERRKRKGGSRALSRFAASGGGGSASWTWRGLGHGVMNFAAQEGSWAWYTGWGGQKSQNGNVTHGYVPKRTHTAAMIGATHAELGTSLSATNYARRGHGAYWTRGHSAIGYEWCHLVAHGMGGPDHPKNLVAATRHQNSEQLIIECVLYGYRMEGFAVQVRAKLAKGTQHLAESIYYQILLNGQSAYTRTMDCRRATQPDFAEFHTVARDLRARLNAALERAMPADDMKYEEWEYIQDNLDEEADDGSNDFWRMLVG
jgi:hypothetical protein